MYDVNPTHSIFCRIVADPTLQDVTEAGGY